MPTWINGIGAITTTGSLTPAGTFEAVFENAKSFQFTGATSKLDLGANFRPAATTPWSVSFWVRFNDITAESFVHLVGNSQTPTFQGWKVFLRRAGTGSQPRINFAWAGTGLLVIEAHETDIVDDTWYHVALTCNGGASGTTKIYINGVPVSHFALSDSFTIENYDSNCFVGVGGGGTEPLAGYIDELGFAMATELSAATIEAIYNGGSPTNLSLATGITNYYRGDSPDTDGTINDRVGATSGSGTDLTISTEVP